MRIPSVCVMFGSWIALVHEQERAANISTLNRPQHIRGVNRDRPGVEAVSVIGRDDGCQLP